jgi:DNA-binding NarL/FixJ family response regulator
VGTKTKIVIAEPQQLVRDGLRQILESAGHQVIADTYDGLEAVKLCVEHRPDVALVETLLASLPGPAAISRIRTEAWKVRCIALSAQESRSSVQQALRAGAVGYVVKSAPAAELIEAVEAVRAGRFFLSPSIAGHLVEAVTAGGDVPAEGLDQLTAREREVLLLIAEGLTSKEIASQLGVSLKTANTHRASLMEKLGIHKAPSLVRFAIREGLIAP